MSDSFESAVDWIARITKPWVQDGRLLSWRMESDEAVLRLRLGVYWLADDEDGQASKISGRWVCNEDAARKLLEMSTGNRAAYDLCKNISASFLHTRSDLPEGLRIFSAMYLADLIDEPKSPRRSITWMRQAALYTWARSAEYYFGLKLTRGDEKKTKMSACDAVSLGLRRNGYAISFRAIKEICVSNKPESQQIRQSHQEWCDAYQFARQAGIIPEHILDAYWNGVGVKDLSPP